MFPSPSSVSPFISEAIILYVLFLFPRRYTKSVAGMFVVFNRSIIYINSSVFDMVLRVVEFS